MNARSLESGQPAASARQTRRAHYALVGALCAGVIGWYAASAESGWLELLGSRANDTYYNLLVQGFRAGQLNLKRDVPPGLARLADPYDPKAIQPYLIVQQPLLDQSYYKGKLYLYFGVTPALVLFWPYAVLTGHPLLHKDAVVIFFSVGFLASVALLWAAWRRYFAGVGVWLLAAGALALGWANFTPAILQHCDVYEVPISCGYALTMVTLLLLWRSLHAGRGAGGWLAGASLAYGLAVGARPTLLFGAVILLLPLAQAWRATHLAHRCQSSLLMVAPEQRAPSWVLLLAATGPILLIGLGLMLYNYVRFDRPLEFGLRYVLSSDRHDAMRHFGLDNLWFNLRVYFLEPARLSGRFPFVHDITVPTLPAGHAAVQNPFGILTNTPLVWLALAVPLVWRGRSGAPASALRWFAVALVLLSGVCALTLGLYTYACVRYQVEFLPALVLLAALGLFGLERTLASRPGWRQATRWVWGLLLAISVAFNLFVMFERSVEAYERQGDVSLSQDQLDEAVIQYEKALALQPDNAEARSNLGAVLSRQGKLPEAVGHLEEALRLKPDSAEVHNNLATALFQLGRVPEALEHYEETLRLKPDYVQAHCNLGSALLRQNRLPEAIEHYNQALRLNPHYAEAHNNLGSALFRQGRVTEAIGHFQQALRLKPAYAEAHYNLGNALLKQGRGLEAVDHFERALRLNPDSVDFQYNLAWLLATHADESVRNGARAVELAAGANQLAGGRNPATLDTLAAAYAEAGRFGEAVKTAQAALDLAETTRQGELAQKIGERLKLYQAGRPYHQE